jgi:hypothetical protein
MQRVCNFVLGTRFPTAQVRVAVAMRAFLFHYAMRAFLFQLLGRKTEGVGKIMRGRVVKKFLFPNLVFRDIFTTVYEQWEFF